MSVQKCAKNDKNVCAKCVQNVCKMCQKCVFLPPCETSDTFLCTRSLPTAQKPALTLTPYDLYI
jgi:hypothetical protein